MSTIFTIKKLILFSLLYKVQFPFNLRLPNWINSVSLPKKLEGTASEQDGYTLVPIRGTTIIHQANKQLQQHKLQVTTPILMITGTHDYMLQKTNKEKLKKLFTQAPIEIKTITTKSHNVLNTHYETIKETMKEWIVK